MYVGGAKLMGPCVQREKIMLSKYLMKDIRIMVHCACASAPSVQEGAKAHNVGSVHQRSVEISKKIKHVAFGQ